MPRLVSTAVCAAALVTACSAPRRTVPSSDPAAGHAASAAAAVDRADAFSVYDLESQWRDQHGAALRLADLAGRPRALALVYTHCSSTCPMIVETMQRLEAATDSNVGFVLVSLDPSRDSTAQLAAYARTHKLSSRWTLLTGSDDDVRELAALIGVRYDRVSETELAHTNTITILDRTGVIAAQEPSWDAAKALAALRTLDR
jgi:protein SCO1/2